MDLKGGQKVNRHVVIGYLKVQRPMGGFFLVNSKMCLGGEKNDFNPVCNICNCEYFLQVVSDLGTFCFSSVSGRDNICMFVCCCSFCLFVCLSVYLIFFLLFAYLYVCLFV